MITFARGIKFKRGKIFATLITWRYELSTISLQHYNKTTRAVFRHNKIEIRWSSSSPTANQHYFPLLLRPQMPMNERPLLDFSAVLSLSNAVIEGHGTQPNIEAWNHTEFHQTLPHVWKWASFGNGRPKFSGFTSQCLVWVPCNDLRGQR